MQLSVYTSSNKEIKSRKIVKAPSWAIKNSSLNIVGVSTFEDLKTIQFFVRRESLASPARISRTPSLLQPSGYISDHLQKLLPSRQKACSLVIQRPVEVRHVSGPHHDLKSSVAATCSKRFNPLEKGFFVCMFCLYN